jgi:uncharacterized membrane protein
MSEYPSEETANEDARRAYNWGIFTWLGNLFGCAVSLVPIALPVGVVLTVVTLITGFGAMMLGTRGKQQAKLDDDDNSMWHARVGWWLGMTHLIIVATVTLVLYLVLTSQIRL